MPSSVTAFLADAYTSMRYPDVPRGRGCVVPSSTILAAPSSLGKCVILGKQVLVARSTIGDYSYLRDQCQVRNTEIGKYCSIAFGVHTGLGLHPLSPFVSTHPAFFLRREANGWRFADRDCHPQFKPVKIGNDVWIGLRASIRDGVTVGDGAIIGAGAVVVADVPPYAIVGGTPAKLIRYRFPPDVIEFLLAFKWWDKSPEWIQENWSKFHDIEGFVREFSTADDYRPAARQTDWAAVASMLRQVV
jgi:acetyltransferase-like isoleucine patch superfamily enzyme